MSKDVVIIGAGVAGCATAYFLGLQGIKSIIIEKDALGDHASGFAFGGLTAFSTAGPAGPEFALAREAFRLHMELGVRLKEETGIDTDIRQVPYFCLATDQNDIDTLRGNLPWLNASGFPAEWLDRQALLQHDSRFADGVLGATCIRGSAILESYKLNLQFASAAEKVGAEIRHGEVVGLETAGGKVTGVRTTRQTIPCDQLVIAAGPWCGPASSWLGVQLPIRPLKGEIVRLRLNPQLPFGRYAWHGDYFSTKQDGLLWTGTTEDEAGFDDRITEAARDHIITKMSEVFPVLMDCEIVKQTACLRPYSPDGLPIVGLHPSLEGAYIATGGSRRGILFSTIMGKAVAELVGRGRTEYDLTPFALDRFN